jgi:NADH-quinone oxidoreductase subunit K
MIPEQYPLLLSAVLFATGAVGVLTRRNAVLIFMSIELMLNAVNLSLITFARELRSLDGQVAVIFVITVAAAEVAVGLSIIVALFRKKETVDVDQADLMKW